MKFSLFRSKASESQPPMAYTGPSYNSTIPPTKRSRGGCCAVNYDTGAVLITFFTLGNGIISLVGGLQWFAAGGSLVPHLDAFEVGVGMLMVVMSSLMLSFMYTRLKKWRVTVLVWGSMYTLFPPAAMIALAVFMGIQNKSANVRQIFVDACNAVITTSPFTDISAGDLQNVCAEENLYYFGRSVLWTAIRAGLQTLFSGVIGFWTFLRFVELGRKEKLSGNQFADPQSIPITEYAAPMGKDEYDNSVERGVTNRAPYEGAGYQAPTYEAAPYRPGLGNGYQI